jgi:glycine/D-amino acid oxidase-like deaminating enzyme
MKRGIATASVAAAAAVGVNATTMAASAATAGGAVDVRSEAAAPAIPAGLPDVVVVGAGAFGGWTALTLRERGATVTLVDAFGPGNPRAASCDETRQIRAGYGDREEYSRWALKAMDLWKKREREWGRQLLYPGARLQLAAGMTPEIAAQSAAFDRLKLPYEIVQPDDLRKRYPQVDFAGVAFGFYEPGAGLLLAREATIEVARQFQKKGGTLLIGQAATFGAATSAPAVASPSSSASASASGAAPAPAVRTGRGSGRTLNAVALNGRDALPAGAIVYACGPWLRKLFPELLGNQIATPRREVFYFGTPPGDAAYSWPNLPQLTEPGALVYPAISFGVKVLPSGGQQLDPDSAERIVGSEQAKRAYDYVAKRFPRLNGQPIVETHVCQTEYTPDRHFVIDRHPDFDNVWIAGGGSGHGFKHGPVVGEYVADRVLGKAGDPALAKIFALTPRQPASEGGVGE